MEQNGFNTVCLLEPRDEHRAVFCKINLGHILLPLQIPIQVFSEFFHILPPQRQSDIADGVGAALEETPPLP